MEKGEDYEGMKQLKDAKATINEKSTPKEIKKLGLICYGICALILTCLIPFNKTIWHKLGKLKNIKILAYL